MVVKRTRLVTYVTVCLCVLTGWLAVGCDGSSNKTAEKKQHATVQTTAKTAPKTPLPSYTIPPAANSGGFCVKVDYLKIKQVLGEPFDVAAASGEEGKPQSCVVRRAGVTFPYLTLARNPVAMTAENFRTDFQPGEASTLDGLGQAAYSKVFNPDQGSGPRTEVGWLTADAVYTVRFTASPDMDPNLAPQLAADLSKLVKELGL
jgi:hypothetical protein